MVSNTVTQSDHWRNCACPFWSLKIKSHHVWESICKNVWNCSNQSFLSTTCHQLLLVFCFCIYHTQKDCASVISTVMWSMPRWVLLHCGRSGVLPCPWVWLDSGQTREKRGKEGLDLRQKIDIGQNSVWGRDKQCSDRNDVSEYLPTYRKWKMLTFMKRNEHVKCVL